RIPAVVVLTRTSRERAERQADTARSALTAPGRRCFRSSQAFNQPLHQAEQAEDQHCQHDVHQDTHVVSIHRNSRSLFGLYEAASTRPSRLEDETEARPKSRARGPSLTLSLRPSAASLRPSSVGPLLSRPKAAVPPRPPSGREGENWALAR